MTEQARARLEELRHDYEIGQRRLQELMAQEVSIRETLLRISGAIQVLEELAGGSSTAGPVSAPVLTVG
jgi:prefoldin subunit 5